MKAKLLYSFLAFLMVSVGIFISVYGIAYAKKGHKNRHKAIPTVVLTIVPTLIPSTSTIIVDQLEYAITSARGLENNAEKLQNLLLTLKDQNVTGLKNVHISQGQVDYIKANTVVYLLDIQQQLNVIEDYLGMSSSTLRNTLKSTLKTAKGVNALKNNPKTAKVIKSRVSKLKSIHREDPFKLRHEKKESNKHQKVTKTPEKHQKSRSSRRK